MVITWWLVVSLHSENTGPVLLCLLGPLFYIATCLFVASRGGRNGSAPASQGSQVSVDNLR